MNPDLISAVLTMISFVSGFASDSPAWFSAFALVATFVLWVLFASLMTIRDRIQALRDLDLMAGRASAGLHSWKLAVLYLLGGVIFIVGYPLDILYNMIVGTVLFRAPPRRGEWTLTARLQRLVRGPAGRNRDIALWMCRYLIEPWDPDHCGMGGKS